MLDRYVRHRPSDQPYDLLEMRRLMEFLDNPQDRLRVIHVAGTSGKTSTAYYVAALLSTANYSTGLTISPHIDKISERIQINLLPLGDTEICQLLEDFLDLVRISDTKPSYFELMIAFAFWIFDKKKVDYAVIEVGLGGLLDATNVINNPDKICVITDIGIDHVKLLGNTVKKIARQKAGIIQSNNPVFTYNQSQAITGEIQRQCQKAGANLHIVSDCFGFDGNIILPSFKKRNLCLAANIVNFILKKDNLTRLDYQQVNSAAHINIPARMEEIRLGSKIVILDGSHNRQKTASLVDAVHQSYDNNIMVLFACGISEKRNLLHKMRLLHQISDTIILTSFEKGQDEVRTSINPETLSIYAKKARFRTIIIERSPEKALEILLNSDIKIGLITGSFYLAARLRKKIQSAQNS